jgi:hypothetical protein
VDGVRFDPYVVDMCATRLHDQGELVSTVAGRFPATTGLVAAQAAIASAQALEDCHRRWTERIAEEGRSAFGYGDAMRSAAAAYLAADDENARQLGGHGHSRGV